jgi:hypothetical protein
MTDKLKQFIEENRAAFDTEEPSPDLFRKMQVKGRSHSLKNILGWKPIRWAAVFVGLLLVSAGIYLGLRKDSPTKSELPEQAINIEKATGIADPVYAKQIYHFQELIGLKQEEIKQLKKDYPDLYKQFVGDLNQLDSAYNALKTTLPENPNREILLEAMIQNLQLQTELLNRQLLIIKEIKQKSKNHEKNLTYHPGNGIMPV